MSERLLNAVKLRKIEDIARIIAFDDDVDLEYRDEKGYTPLFFAAVYGDRQIIEMLIRAGADVNHPDNNGVTPLMIAVANYDIDTIFLLLDANASISQQDADGNSAVDIARYAGFSDIADKMIEVAQKREYLQQEEKRKNIQRYKNKHRALRSYIKSTIKRP